MWWADICLYFDHLFHQHFLFEHVFFVIVHTNKYTYANNREQNYYYYMSYNMYIYVVQYAKLNKIKDKGNNTFEAPSTRLNTL